MRIKVSYWRQLKAEYEVEHGFPCFFSVGFKPGDMGRYGSPCIEYPQHVKVCAHDGDEVDPDSRDMGPLKTEDMADVSDFIRKHLPGLDPTPSITETCIYTMTPDENFIMDSHPLYKNIILGAGFSGHGFKLAPVVGKILSGLALQKLEDLAQYDLVPFQVQRFGSSVLISPKSRI